MGYLRNGLSFVGTSALSEAMPTLPENCLSGSYDYLGISRGLPDVTSEISEGGLWVAHQCAILSLGVAPK